MVSNRAEPGWLEANELWPAGCQSCVSTTWSKRSVSRLMTGTTASPSPTASAPPGQKSFCTSMTSSTSLASICICDFIPIDAANSSRTWIKSQQLIAEPRSRSGSDPKRGALLAQARDHRQRGNAAGLRVLRRDVLDRHRKARGIGIDLDAVRVARHGRVGPDLHPRQIGPDPRQRERDPDVQIGRKSPRRLTGRSLEDA